LLLFIALGFAIGQGSSAHLTQTGAATPKGWLLALIPVMFTYSGWNAASYVAEEIRTPGRNVPRALALGTGAVVALYLLLNALYLYVVPVDQLAAVKGSMLDLVADRQNGRDNHGAQVTQADQEVLVHLDGMRGISVGQSRFGCRSAKRAADDRYRAMAAQCLADHLRAGISSACHGGSNGVLQRVGGDAQERWRPVVADLRGPRPELLGCIDGVHLQGVLVIRC